MSEHKQFFLEKQGQAIDDGAVLETPSIKRIDKDLNVKNLHIITDNETKMNHGQKIKVNEIISGSANTHYASLSDYNIAIKDVTISRGVQLPKASLAGLGKIYLVKDMSGSALTTTIAIAPLDGELINGDTGDTLNLNYDCRRYVSDGSNWFTW